MYERGDVIRSFDPFKLDEDAERYWLVVNNDTHPFGDEQYIAVTLTTKNHPPSLPIKEGAWKEGGVPRESFVSPWAVHSPRVETITGREGRLTPRFVQRVLDEVAGYLA